jgi:translation initiation factor IF-2
MPVRIYEIAKELGVENKVVLAKAKDLHITAAKVPSSSLDKITGEFLRDELKKELDALGAAAPAPEPAQTAPAPTEEPKIVFVRPTPPPEPAPESEPTREFEPAPAPGPEAAAVEPPPVVETPPAPQPEPPRAQETPSVAEPIQKPPVAAAAPPSEPKVEPEPARDHRAQPPAAPKPQPPAAPKPQPPPAPKPPQATIGAVARQILGTLPPGPSYLPPKAPTPPPAAPAAPAPAGPPAKPGLGDKVGFINLGGMGRRDKPEERRENRPPERGRQETARPDDRRGRDDRRPGPGQGGGQFQGRGPGQQPQQRPPAPPKQEFAPNAPTIVMRPPIVVRELADKIGRKPFQVIADLMQMGVFATVTQTIDTEVAAKVSAKNGFRFETEKRDKAAHTVNVPKEQKLELDQEDDPAHMKARPPVVTIMGHVDHGKTTLLDRIRKSNVAAGESGGITQHIGAYTIAYPHPITGVPERLTFLDTPGHAAFSAMRARGANVTDVVVLVVAANDGVMPQTIEALSHARAAHAPILVAVNKCDHPAANGLKVRQQLQEKGLVPDDWGGDTLYVDCSGLTGAGVDKLIEAILLQAELLELKANPDRKAKGNVIESGVGPGGPEATVLVRKGSLHLGDVVICGEHYGKVRAMMDEEGARLKVAGPSVAVRLLGLNGVPEAGSEFSAVDDERAARSLASDRFEERKKSELEGVRPKRQTLEDIYGQINDLAAKVLKVIVKADTQGSVEAISEALAKIESNKVSLEIIHAAVGAISESDVLLASSANAVVIGFHTRVDSSAAEAAKRDGVQIKLFAIIYELIDLVREAMAGMLDPLLKEVVVGQAEVRKIFDLSKGGKVAGCAVTNGRLVRGKMRVRRGGHAIYEGVSLTLKRFQDEVPEVRSGLECGVRLDGFEDIEPGDIIECYTVEKVAQKL